MSFNSKGQLLNSIDPGKDIESLYVDEGNGLNESLNNKNQIALIAYVRKRKQSIGEEVRESK